VRRSCEIAPRGSGPPLVARRALGAYPLWWRERYGQGQESFLKALAGDRRPLGRAVVNLAIGAARVRLSPYDDPHDRAGRP
jgi:hypothetical protein